MDELKTTLTRLLLKEMGRELLGKARKKQKDKEVPTASLPEDMSIVERVKEAVAKLHGDLPRIRESFQQLVDDIKQHLTVLHFVQIIASKKGETEKKWVESIIEKSGLPLAKLGSRIEFLETNFNNFLRMLEKIEVRQEDIEVYMEGKREE